MVFYEILVIVYLIVAVMLIGFVLIQQGKGAGMGASFGSGGSNTVFGSTGSGNFLTRTTAILATLFFVISLILGNQTADKEKAVDDWQNLEVPVVEEAVDTDVPVVPVTEQTMQSTTDADVPVTEAPKEDDVPNL
ncbi:preprotein translocase subunit SecG [Paraglaciecola arctica]|uniref:Protein-export membrane protein SecG n=1 Tax=Paraglaciecola arctica BSs20135 TaxID=493475 RepID=K6Z3U3_9ALTE|nr:preprotein translocase subunit SecG [Paraglaciecola arctica]GAC18105.1 preprotein translocase subunit SecG [Paraglaciecola arctica BSs20135]